LGVSLETDDKRAARTPGIREKTVSHSRILPLTTSKALATIDIIEFIADNKT